MIVQRSDAAGGDGWNLTTASSQVPWLLNRRYGSFLPTRHQPLGRGIGFSDWLWGSAPIANLPAPQDDQAIGPAVHDQHGPAERDPGRRRLEPRKHVGRPQPLRAAGPDQRRSVEERQARVQDRRRPTARPWRPPRPTPSGSAPSTAPVGSGPGLGRGSVRLACRRRIGLPPLVGHLGHVHELQLSRRQAPPVDREERRRDVHVQRFEHRLGQSRRADPGHRPRSSSTAPIRRPSTSMQRRTRPGGSCSPRPSARASTRSASASSGPAAIRP